MKNPMIFVVAALATAILPAHAANEVNSSVTVNLTIATPCGEVINLSGPLHTVVTYTVTPNGISGSYHFDPQGISGVGETGIRYEAVGATQQDFHESYTQTNLNYVNNFRLVGQRGQSYLMHEDLHILISGGSTRVYHDNFSIECR
jgi:hypothetical protein